MPRYKDPPCWGEIGLSLLPASCSKALLDLNSGIEYHRKKLPTGIDVLGKEEDWSLFVWPISPIETAVTLFDKILKNSNARALLDFSILHKPLTNPRAVTSIPFLTETWENLESIFPDPLDLASTLSHGRAYELLELIGSTQSFLDIAISAPSWTEIADGAFGVKQPEVPNNFEAAVFLLQERLIRASCFPTRLQGHASNWPRVLASRSGIPFPEKISLEKASNFLGITRERVRQVLKQYPVFTARRRWPLSDWQKTLSAVLQNSHNETLAIFTENLTTSLKQISKEDRATITGLGFEKIASLLDCFGHPQNLEIDSVGKIRHPADALNLPDTITIKQIQGMVWSLSEKTGILREADLEKALSNLLPGTTKSQLAEILDAAIGSNRLPLGYLFFTIRADSILQNTIKKMLSWANPLSIEELYDGLNRRLKFRQLAPLPPIEVFLSIIGRMPGLIVEKGFASLVKPLDPDRSTVLGKLGSLLQAAEGNVLHRYSIAEQMHKAGQKPASTFTYMQFGEIIANVGQGCIKLIGSNPTPLQIKKARDTALRNSKKTKITFSQAKGDFCLTVCVGNDFRNSGVLPISKELRILIGDHKLVACSTENEHGHIAVSGSALYGFNPVLNALDIVPGETITIRLDLNAMKALITLTD